MGKFIGRLTGIEYINSAPTQQLVSEHGLGDPANRGALLLDILAELQEISRILKRLTDAVDAQAGG